MTRVLAVDLGARCLGWAAGEGADVLGYGLKEMPGLGDLGLLYRATRNELETLVLKYQPDYMRFVPMFVSRGRVDKHGEYHAPRTSTLVAEALSGLQGLLKLVCSDNTVTLEPLDERSVRKYVLGKCDFGRKDERTGKLIPNAGREEAKRTVLDWCEAQGYRVASHDVGDALVLLRYQIPPPKPVKRRIRELAF